MGERMKKFAVAMMGIAAAGIAAGAVVASDDWMPGRVGVFAHYLPEESTFRYTENFDVAGLVSQLRAMKADYFLLTLGQNSGWYCAPNATYEGLAGYGTGERCSRRDIPAEIIAALKGTGIRFGLYLPCQPANRDTRAAVRFGLAEKGVNGGNDRYLTAEAAERWAAVIREWAVRYGEGVSLWWFDGAYGWCGFNDEIAKLYKAACRAGNPAVPVAFNGGVRNLAPESQSDFWAGEENEPLSVVPHEGRWHRPGVQWHVVTPMGFTWMWPDCRFRDATFRDWIHQCTSRGGMCTLEMKIDIKTGILDRGQSEQFARICEGRSPGAR